MPEIIVININQPEESKTINLSLEKQIINECILGRDTSCGIVLKDIMVSRIHGKFILRNNSFYYCDLGSRNGSKINNEIANPNQEYLLKPSDTIAIGNHLLWVKAIARREVSAAPQALTPEQYMPLAKIDTTSLETWKQGTKQVKCVQIIEETIDVKTFTFVAEPPVQFNYQPGQFVTLNLNISGKQVKRSYSISSTPSRPHTLEITVKRVPAPADAPPIPPGLVSNWLHDNMRVGSQIEINAPMGKFTNFAHPSAKLLLISAGSGITPMMSMSRWICDTVSNVDIVFLHSARSPEDIIFRQELEMMAARYLNFKLAITITRPVPSQPWDGYTGRIDETMLLAIAPDYQERNVYVCGPNSFMEASSELLQKINFPMENYYEESFGGAKKKKKPAATIPTTDRPPIVQPPATALPPAPSTYVSPASTPRDNENTGIFLPEYSTDLELSDEVLEEPSEILYETSINSVFSSPWDEEEEDSAVGSLPDIDFADDITSPIPVPNIPQSANKILYRYPYLECPDRLPINQKFSLYVQILIQSPEPNIRAMEIEDSGKLEEPPELEIVLRARGFDIEGSNTKIIKVDRDDDTEERFVLIPRQLGEQQIRVDFYQNDKRIGTTRRNIFISTMDNLASIEVVQPKIETTLEIKNQFLTSPPDLELCIELDRHDRKTLYFTLHSTKPEIDYHHRKIGQVTLQDSPEEKILSVYQELNQLAARLSRKLITEDIESRESEDRDDLKIAEDRIVSVGNRLWDELIPDTFKEEYWKFKDNIKSLLITSDEPWIPWEMIKPYDLDREIEDSFWCERFALSRWLSGPSTADEFNAESVITVAPNNSNLPNVKKELDFLKKLDNLRSQISSVLTIDNGLRLKEYIKNHTFSILHFACHGMFNRNLPNDSAIELTNDSLRPSDIKIKFKKVRPIIFINACHGGRAGFSFTNIGGWAKRFVNARAGVFIGAMWEVNDELAYQFAETFYTALLRDNLTIAESFQKSRQVIRELAPYNSTWLAYSLYADPEAKIKLPNLNNVSNLSFSESSIQKPQSVTSAKSNTNIHSPNLINNLSQPFNQIQSYIVCHNCRHHNPINGKFCTKCGSKLVK